jgi:hypothetical protein
VRIQTLLRALGRLLGGPKDFHFGKGIALKEPLMGPDPRNQPIPARTDRPRVPGMAQRLSAGSGFYVRSSNSQPAVQRTIRQWIGGTFDANTAPRWII